MIWGQPPSLVLFWEMLSMRECVLEIEKKGNSRPDTYTFCKMMELFEMHVTLRSEAEHSNIPCMM
jgi:hypothetical protein